MDRVTFQGTEFEIQVLGSNCKSLFGKGDIGINLKHKEGGFLFTLLLISYSIYKHGSEI